MKLMVLIILCIFFTEFLIALIFAPIQREVYMCENTFETTVCDKISRNNCIQKDSVKSIRICDTGWLLVSSLLNETSTLYAIHIMKIDEENWAIKIGDKCFLYGDVQREVKC